MLSGHLRTLMRLFHIRQSLILLGALALSMTVSE